MSTRLRPAYPAIGLSPDGGLTWTLPRAVGAARARHILLTDRVIGAEEALALGLVALVVPDDDVVAEAEALARRLAEGPVRALGRTKSLVRADRTLAEQLEVKVGQSELLDYLLNASRQYGMDPNEFIKTLDESGQIPSVVAEVARSKALAVALRRVEVKDAAGNVVDLSEFVGTDAEDAAADASDAAEVAAAEASENDEQA